MKKFKFLNTMKEYADMTFGRPRILPADRLVALLNSLKDQINTLDSERTTQISILQNTLESFYNHASGMVSNNRALVQENIKLKEELEECKKLLERYGSN